MYKTLIVEPQEFSLHSLQELPVWEKACNGFVCTMTASNGEEALKLINTMDFDLILTEINLSICDGLQLLKQIHKDNRPPLVVFISDIVSFSYAREGFIYGAFDYLPKPVNKESMETLFDRASQELEKMKQAALPPKNAKLEKSSFFTVQELSQLLTKFLQQNNTVLKDFQRMLQNLYRTAQTAQPHDVIANRLYTTIVKNIYKRNSWLTLYLPQDFHKQIDYLVLHDSDDYIDYYLRKLTYLYHLFCLMRPRFQEETLMKVHLYLLENPEADLKLTSVAERFYMNHTYLSNLFSKKANVQYSQLVKLVKMKRAEYLLNYTEIPVADIAYRLGYKDIQHFSQLFKSVIGKLPSEFNRSEEDYFNYSI